MRSCLAVAMALVLGIGSLATVNAQGEAAVLFLLINPGARQGGMGEAGVAAPNDATAIYWNPAGLAFQYDKPEENPRGQASIMHVQWLPQFNLSDLYYDYAAGRFYLKNVGMVGLGIQYMNYGENVQTDVQGNEVGRFTSNEFAVTGSYALKLQNNLGFGVNLKYIYSKLSDVSVDAEKGKGIGTSFAVDLGLLYHPGFAKNLSLGVNLSNFGPKITYIDKEQADPIPTNLRLGLAYRIINSEFNKLTFVYDANRLLVPRDEEKRRKSFVSYIYNGWDGSVLKRFSHSFGLEYWYTNLIALRSGYFYEDPSFGDRNFWTFGGGLKIAFLGVDFSYILATADDHPLANTMRFSLSADF